MKFSVAPSPSPLLRAPALDTLTPSLPKHNITSQDQCATIKRQLCLLLPGVSIFLDVDDLKDIGELETYVAQSAVIMIFVSKGYVRQLRALHAASLHLCTAT